MRPRHLLAQLLHPIAQVGRFFKVKLLGRLLHLGLQLIDQLEAKMKEAAKKLDFEEAANLRDRVKQLRQKMAGSH